MLPNYALEYDEELDAIGSLELLAEHIPRVITVPHHWKWVLLSLHSALQGFMVLALQGTNALNVLKKESAEHWSQSYEEGLPPTKPLELDAFMRLYSKIKSDSMRMAVDSGPFVANSTQDESVRKLNAFRNEFMHFVPALALLDTRTWVELTIDVIPIVEFLAFHSRNVTFHEDGAEERVRGFCALIRSEAAALRVYYGA